MDFDHMTDAEIFRAADTAEDFYSDLDEALGHLTDLRELFSGSGESGLDEYVPVIEEMISEVKSKIDECDSIIGKAQALEEEAMTREYWRSVI